MSKMIQIVDNLTDDCSKNIKYMLYMQNKSRKKIKKKKIKGHFFLKYINEGNV